MNIYQNFTIQIIFESSVSTPLQSDTIFGHICWAVRFLDWKGEDKLSDFLAHYENRISPPLLISSGFPKGYLPKPILPPVKQKFLDDRFTRENRMENSFKIKTIKEMDIIPNEKFKALQDAIITPETLFTVMNESYKDMTAFKEKCRNMVVQHNTIDRINGTVRDGGLYSQEETFFDDNSREYIVYLKTNYFTRAELYNIFTFISKGGYGKDKSTGKGYFHFEIKEGVDLLESETPNAFMTLSSFVPNENDPSTGYYRIVHKYGKLGGLYAKGISEVMGNPFKVPLIMFSAGSVFRDKGYKQGNVYGSLLKDVHKNENIRHYAYAFPIGINIEDSYEDT